MRFEQLFWFGRKCILPFARHYAFELFILDIVPKHRWQATRRRKQRETSVQRRHTFIRRSPECRLSLIAFKIYLWWWMLRFVYGKNYAHALFKQKLMGWCSLWWYWVNTRNISSSSYPMQNYKKKDNCKQSVCHYYGRKLIIRLAAEISYKPLPKLICIVDVYKQKSRKSEVMIIDVNIANVRIYSWKIIFDSSLSMSTHLVPLFVDFHL